MTQGQIKTWTPALSKLSKFFEHMEFRLTNLVRVGMGMPILNPQSPFQVVRGWVKDTEPWVLR